MMYQLPSSNETMISVPAELRDSLSCLDIAWSDMFESKDSVIDSKVCRKYETDFLKGAPPQWLNFYTSTNSPLVERDRFKKLKQLVEEKRRKRRLITEVSLQYQPGSGGSTLAMQVLWHFRKDLRCARVINSGLDTKKLSKKVVDLFLLSNEEHTKPNRKTVLLLLDTKENTNDDLLIKSTLRKNLNKEIHERNITTNTPVVIILNCSPADLLTIGQSTDDVKLTMKLSTDEKLRFAQKKKQLKNTYNKMSEFHAFNIMQGGFQEKDAEDLITKEMKEYVKNHKKSSSTKLLSFLALINSYVPGSHLSKLFCEEFMDRTEQTTDDKNPTLETRMKPFMDLIVIFSEDEQNSQCIRLAHPMIAHACLKMFTEHKVKRSHIALDFLNSLEKEKASSYLQICKSMFVTRLKTEQGKQLFSRLILDIIRENDTDHCIRLLELASALFSEDPFCPQTLARLFYIKVNNYDEAKKWARVATKINPAKSDLKDTLGQVYKKQLDSENKETLSDMKACLPIAQSAIDAFKEEEEAAEDEAEDNTKFNNRGLFGFLQVCKIIHPKKPLEGSDQVYNNFISSLKGDVESRYDFFEWYLAFSRPSINKEEPDYLRNEIEECYKRYFTQSGQTDEDTLNEKKNTSFGGLLHFLKSDISLLKRYTSKIENPQTDNETQIIVYILANILLSQSKEPCANTDDLQARLQELWVSKERDRSPEFYLLILLLFWPDDVQPAITNPPNLENCVKYLSQSKSIRKYQKYLRGRYLVPLFFFGKGEGLQRLIHTSKLDQMDQECLIEGHEKAEVECLQRINGKVKNNEVFAVVQGQKIQVTPHNWVSVCKPGQVSFYLGFNIRGPVAYNIRYEDNEVTSELHG